MTAEQAAPYNMYKKAEKLFCLFAFFTELRKVKDLLRISVI